MHDDDTMTEYEQAVYAEWAAEQPDGGDTSLAAFADHLASEAEARDEAHIARGEWGVRQ